MKNMKKLILYVFSHSSGINQPSMVCQDETGEVNRAITDTLLDAVSELSPLEYALFEEIMQQVETGTYHPVAPDEAHWAGNATVAWFGEPKAGKDSVLIANEYVPEFSEEDGEPQRFSFEQLKLVMKVWFKFKRELAEHEAQSMRGRMVEIPFPT